MIAFVASSAEAAVRDRKVTDVLPIVQFIETMFVADVIALAELTKFDVVDVVKGSPDIVVELPVPIELICRYAVI
jgi:hypothetical protein